MMNVVEAEGEYCSRRTRCSRSYRGVAVVRDAVITKRLLVDVGERESKQYVGYKTQ